jgi:uncharacterized membrane protein
MTTAEAIMWIGLIGIGLIFTICTYIWKHITLGMAGAVYWVIIGMQRLLSSADLTTLDGAIGLFSLVMGIMTGTLPFVLKKKPDIHPQLSQSELLETRLKRYGNISNVTIVKKQNIPKPWYDDDDS